MKGLPRTPFPYRTLLRYGLALLLALALLTYVLFQGRQFIAGPLITLVEGLEPVQTQRVVVLRGTVSNISHLSLNGRPILTDPDGNFEEAVVLENGYTIHSINARDRYGRTAEVQIPLVYTPTTATTTH